MRRLTEQEAGLIHAALEHLAEDHPDETTADRCRELAELVATRDVLIDVPDAE